MVLVLSFIITIISLIYAIHEIKRKDFKKYIPSIINLTTLIVFFFFPLDALVIKADFYFNLNQREEVIKKIKNKELFPNVSYNKDLIHLPSKYKHLSK
jgi:hypothetical protein